VQISAACWECLFRLVEWIVPDANSTSVAMCLWQTWVVLVREVLGRPGSSCWRRHLLREEFLSALIHSPTLWSPVRSFSSKTNTVCVLRVVRMKLHHETLHCRGT
jgi:hypothetical protein